MGHTFGRIQSVSPSIVGINTSGAAPQSGSGIIVSDRGYVLTNSHVVSGASNIVVTLVHGQLVKSYAAHLLEDKPKLDLALVQINTPGKTAFPPAPLGNSDTLYIGQQVLAIGNPFGLAQSASAGIISNTQRTLTTGNRVFRGLIQTDASINPGSSGGALVTARGEVVGINTAIFSPVDGFTGVGFAVPINQAKEAFPDFIRGGRSPNAAAGQGSMVRQIGMPVIGSDLKLTATAAAPRAWVGIDTSPLEDVVVRAFHVPVHYGVLVNRVFEHSPAAKAGLERGDVVYRVNNRRIKDSKMLWSVLKGKKPGDVVRITVFRNGHLKSYRVWLEPEPPNIRSLLSRAARGGATGEAGEFGIEEISWLGIDIQPIEVGEATMEFGVDPNQSGVLVGEVEGIAAVNAGLLSGDVIKKVNAYEIHNIQTFKNVITKVDPSKGVLLDVRRQGRPVYITIQSARRDRGAWQ